MPMASSSSPRLNLRTTAHVIKQSTISFATSFHTFVFLSLLLFSFRTAVENGSLLLTSFLDRDPTVQTLISRLSDPPPPSSASNNNDNDPSQGAPTANAYAYPYPNHNHHNRRRRPFLHLSRVGTLDDDFFSDDHDDFRRSRRPPVNGSSINLSSSHHFFRRETKLGLPILESGEEIRVLEIAGSGFLFFTDGGDHRNNETGSAATDGEGAAGEDRPSDIRIFGHDIHLDRRDAATLFFLVTFLSAAYGWVILGFLFSYCCVLGVVFFAVVNTHLGRHHSFFETVRSGSRLGLRRLAGFVLLRWAVRDALTQFLGLWFFSDIEDQFSFFKLFVRLKLMPFSIFSPWEGGDRDALAAAAAADISGFLLVWALLDSFVNFVSAIDSWVAILDTRRSGQEIVKEGFYLLSTMIDQASRIKCLEALFCGSFMRGLLARAGGTLLASFLQSLAEVYFMVAWLIFYFAARCKDAEMEGSRFGQRDLEEYVDGLR
ncbi:hypothetical protein AAC387_Pa01g4424 [Persea americana]